MQQSAELDFLLQSDWRSGLLQKLGTDIWTTVYLIDDKSEEKLAIYSSLIPNSRVSEALSETRWDISIGHGQPGCTTWHENGEMQVRYDHFTSPDSIQPLVIVRDFYGVRSGYVEILEEFRLFHNLYFETNSNTYLKFNENGDEDPVVRITHKKVQIRTKEIKQFLAFKDMHLAIYFDIDRFSHIETGQIAEAIKRENYLDSVMCYAFFIDTAFYFSRSEFKSFSRLHGKKLVPGFSKEKSGIWPYEPERQYEDYIIGVDENGAERVFSANPDNLANYFGANLGNPHYLTPVFFRREVLSKYYSDPHKYEVHDGYIECKGYWQLRADTNNMDHIIIFLGDLGRDLPYSEQRIWRSYNVVPDGQLSNVTFRRSMLGEFTDPEEPALTFKYRFQIFQETWYNKMGWYLFKPLGSKDEHLYTSLHIPVTNGQSEFDNQVIALTKILVDSINEEKLKELLRNHLSQSMRGISKLEKFLELQTFPDYKQHIDFIRKLQLVRSVSAAHRKGSDFQKEMEKYDVDLASLSATFSDFLKQSVDFIDALQHHFLI